MATGTIQHSNLYSHPLHFTGTSFKGARQWHNPILEYLSLDQSTACKTASRCELNRHAFSRRVVYCQVSRYCLHQGINCEAHVALCTILLLFNFLLIGVTIEGRCLSNLANAAPHCSQSQSTGEIQIFATRIRIIRFQVRTGDADQHFHPPSNPSQRLLILAGRRQRATSSAPESATFNPQYTCCANSRDAPPWPVAAAHAPPHEQ